MIAEKNVNTRQSKTEVSKILRGKEKEKKCNCAKCFLVQRQLTLYETETCI